MPRAVHVASAQDRYPGTTLQILARGRDVYVMRCGACHTLVLPEEKTPDEWTRIVPVMAPRAALSPADQDAVTRYLVGVSATYPERP